MFSKKSIRVLIQNADDEFKKGINTLEFKNLPIEANIKATGSDSISFIRIYGISKEHINSITNLPSLGLVQEKHLKIALYVDDGLGESIFYVGSIRDACPHYTNAPDVYIDIQCVALAFQNLVGDIPPHSFERGASVPDMYKAVCASYNIPCTDLTTEKEFAEKPPILNQKSAKFRLDALKEAYKKTTYTTHNEVVYVLTKGSEVVQYMLTPKDYIGYPTFTQTGISLKLDKVLRFVPNRDSIKISESELDMINTTWNVISVEYNISTKISGKWEMTIGCSTKKEISDVS